MSFNETALARLLSSLAGRTTSDTGSEQIWTVCVFDERHQAIASFEMTSLEHVRELQGRLEEYGYMMKILDPDSRHCDFVVRPDAMHESDLPITFRVGPT